MWWIGSFGFLLGALLMLIACAWYGHHHLLTMARGGVFQSRQIARDKWMAFMVANRELNADGITEAEAVGNLFIKFKHKMQRELDEKNK